MNRQRSPYVTWLLGVGVVVAIIGSLLRSRVQAWEATLGPGELIWVKALVVAAVGILAATGIWLMLAKRRAAAATDQPDA